MKTLNYVGLAMLSEAQYWRCAFHALRRMANEKLAQVELEANQTDCENLEGQYMGVANLVRLVNQMHDDLEVGAVMFDGEAFARLGGET
jgi:hypothetical protein